MPPDSSASSAAVVKNSTASSGAVYMVSNATGVSCGRGDKSNKGTYHRVLLEVGCGSDSLLGRAAVNTNGCHVVRFIESDDVCSTRGLLPLWAPLTNQRSFALEIC